jgi:hypothetical protein
MLLFRMLVEDAHQRLDGVPDRLEYQRHSHAGGSSGGFIVRNFISSTGCSRTRTRTRLLQSVPAQQSVHLLVVVQPRPLK